MSRKEVFVSTANLSAAFHRMLSEPKSKQRNSSEIYEFVVLNNVLSSNIAGFIAGIRDGDQLYSKEILQQVKRSISSIEESLQLLDKNYLLLADTIKVPVPATKGKQGHSPLFEQLDFIYKLTTDIRKVTRAISP